MILLNFQLIFHMFEEVILSSLMKSLSCIKFFRIWNISKWNSNLFKNPLDFKWKKSCHLHSGVLCWNEFEFIEIKCKDESLGKSFRSLSSNFKSFKFHSLSVNQSNKQSYNLFNITFQNLEFWDVTNLPHLKWISSSRFEEASKKG